MLILLLILVSAAFVPSNAADSTRKSDHKVANLNAHNKTDVIFDSNETDIIEVIADKKPENKANLDQSTTTNSTKLTKTIGETKSFTNNSTDSVDQLVEKNKSFSKSVVKVVAATKSTTKIAQTTEKYEQNIVKVIKPQKINKSQKQSTPDELDVVEVLKQTNVTSTKSNHLPLSKHTTTTKKTTAFVKSTTTTKKISTKLTTKSSNSSSRFRTSTAHSPKPVVATSFTTKKAFTQVTTLPSKIKALVQVLTNYSSTTPSYLSSDFLTSLIDETNVLKANNLQVLTDNASNIVDDILSGHFSVQNFTLKLKEENVTLNASYFERYKDTLDKSVYANLLDYVLSYLPGEVRFDTLISFLVEDVLSVLYPEARFIATLAGLTKTKPASRIQKILPSFRSYLSLSQVNSKTLFEKYQHVLGILGRQLSQSSSASSLAQQAAKYANFSRVFIISALAELHNLATSDDELIKFKNTSVINVIQWNYQQIKKLDEKLAKSAASASSELIKNIDANVTQVWDYLFNYGLFYLTNVLYKF
jgi:hypothetical protein